MSEADRQTGFDHRERFGLAGVASTFYYLSAWSSGLNALLFAFLGCFFLIGQPASIRSSIGLMIWISLAFAFTFFYLYVALPRVTAYPVLIGVLGVGMIPLGVFANMSMAGLLVASNGLAFLGLQNAYQADFDQSLLSLGGSLAGLLIATTSMYVLSYDRPRFVARRLVRAVRLDVADAAAARRTPSRQRFLSLCVDRLALFFTAVEGFDRDDPLNRVDMISDLRVGANLLALREDERRLSPAVSASVVRLRQAVATAFHDYARGKGDIKHLAPFVDACLDAVLATPQDALHERLLLALTGLRLALEPDASLAGPQAVAAVRSRSS